VRVVQDELGYALGKAGGSMVEFWRKGNLPAKQQDLDALARLLVARGGMERAWLEELLLAAGYGVGGAALCDALFPARSRRALPSPPAAAVPGAGRHSPLCRARRRNDRWRAAVLLEPSGLAVAALVGMGGAGKSTLAAQIAHTLAGDFPDGVLWVYAADAEPLDILQHWAQLYGADFRTIADVENRAAAVRGLWAWPPRADRAGRRACAGAAASAAARRRGRRGAPHHPRPRPGRAGQCAGDRPAGTGRGAEPGAAARHRRAGAPAREPDAAAAIVRGGHLPLALEIVARLLARAPWQSLAEMAARLADATQRLDRLALKDLSVRAAFAVSWATLTDDLRQLFACLGLFEARPCAPAALAATAGVTQAQVADALPTLAALSLVQMTATGHVRQHPLLADFAREHLTDPAAPARWVAYHLDLCPTHAASPDLIDAELDNLMAVLAALHTPNLQSPNLQSLNLPIPQSLLTLAAALHPTWLAHAHYAQARRGYGWAVTAAEQIGDAAAQAQALIRLGYVCYEQSDYPAAATQLAAGLAAAQAAGDAPLAAEAQFSLARIAIEQNELEEADELLSACLRASRRRPMMQRGWRAPGASRGCWPIARATTPRRSHAAPRRWPCRSGWTTAPGVLATVRLLADAAMATGDLAAALAHGERALALAEVAGLRAELAEAHFTVATALRLRGELTGAEHHVKAALALFEQMGNRSYLAYALHEQSVILTYAGETAAALPPIERAYAIQVALGDSYGRATTMIHLGELFRRLGDPARAVATWRTGWALAQEIRYPHIQIYEKKLAEVGTGAG
jgi:tetratricopeptide (TPR) repeat protein